MKKQKHTTTKNGENNMMEKNDQKKHLKKTNKTR